MVQMIARASRPPAVVIVNPQAGRLSGEQREEVIEALSEVFRLEIATTRARGGGIEPAHAASDSGVPLVIAFGGDGHVNEVANGVAGSASTLGIVPGGTMNVFARALGIPNDPMEAVKHLAEAVQREERLVHLGQMDDRYFTFSAGCGFDAEAAERVERDIPSKRRFGELFFYWSAFRVLAGTYRHRNPSMTVKGDFGEVPVAMAIACNAGPYAYLGGRAVTVAPEVDLDGGIDVFAMKKMRLEALPMYTWNSVFSGNLVSHGDAFYESNLEEFDIVADKPFPRHVDGEPLDPATSTHFRIARNILRVTV
jgi:diacylglycerol kinase family enzyme